MEYNDFRLFFKITKLIKLTSKISASRKSWRILLSYFRMPRGEMGSQSLRYR